MANQTEPLTLEWTKARLEQDIAQAHERYDRRLQRLEDMKRPLPEPSDFPCPNPRYEQAVIMREQGNTFAQIGERLGVTAGRAGQMVKKGIRLREKAKEPSGKLSARARNILANFLGIGWPHKDSRLAEITPERVSDISYFELKDSSNCGKHSLNEIRMWLRGHGLDLKK
ncbi:MAG: hypothetical protein H0W39_01100 [Sphingomonas sp.]|nr:hypothetical protein [Sphingomonas sp.]